MTAVYCVMHISGPILIDRFRDRQPDRGSLSAQFDEVLKSAARIANEGAKRAALVSFRSSDSEETRKNTR